jgi:hypothetical protein
MIFNQQLHALDALLTVGQRSPSKLAANVDVTPPEALEEILDTGATTYGDMTALALEVGRPDADRLVDAGAAVDELGAEGDALERRRKDDLGPVEADRFWLTQPVAILAIGIVLILGVALVLHGFTGGRVDAALVLVLATTVSAFAGDWAGRARTPRRILLASVLVAAALAAALAVVALHDQAGILAAVDVAVILLGAFAGYLTGRSRWLVPALRLADQQHANRTELAHARPVARVASGAVASVEAEYAAAVEQIAARVLRAVDEYIGAVARRLPTPVSSEDLRRRAADVVGSWPRNLDLVSR